jgi:hypothetical protein
MSVSARKQNKLTMRYDLDSISGSNPQEHGAEGRMQSAPTW